MTPAWQVRVLGRLSVRRDGAEVALPRSRKVRALLGFLAVTPGFVARSRLCDLLWDGPDDPRGELRWCLSKIRGFLNHPDGPRVIASDDLVALDLGDCLVDALEADRVAQAGLGAASRDRLAEVCGLFDGDLLDGLELDGHLAFTGWLAAQRHRYRELRTAALEALVGRSPLGSEEALSSLRDWLQLAPFDPRPHAVFLAALVQRGRPREADEHLARTIRAFERGGVDWMPLRDVLRAARAAAPVPPAPTPSTTTAPGSCSRYRCRSIRRSHARMPACPSRTSRTPFSS